MNRIDYGTIGSELRLVAEEDKIGFLADRLPDMWSADYEDHVAACQLNFIDIGTFCVIFDLAQAAGGNADERQEDRVVAIYGLSCPPKAARDAARMRGYLGKTRDIFGAGFDKGHFIAHSAGGDILDSVNWFPQERRLNRGWSEQGSLYRSLERYCAANPDTFMFSRPIYSSPTTWPDFLEFGVLRGGALEVLVFDNRRIQEPA